MASPCPSLAREAERWEAAHLLVGVDEVGRGPLAGPVVAAAVIFPPRVKRLNGLRDSKVLTAPRRERLALKVRERALCFALGAASSREIDRYNIRVASAMAMRRAVARVLGYLSVAGTGANPGESVHILIDGLPLPELGYPHQALVDGDAYCASIAAAAVVAKTVRDLLMRRLAVKYPGYGWETNAGYATEHHCAALDRLGPTRHHRLSFEPIAQFKLF
ncbi:MAG: ribonuclease HII [Gemmatimonadota bacterium]